MNTRLLTCDQIFFDYMLMKYLREEMVDEEPEFDMVISTAPQAMNITSTLGKDEDDGTTLNIVVS